MSRYEALATPIRFGPYALTHRVGMGILGEVFKAHESQHPQKKVAIKFIYPIYSQHGTLIEALGQRCRFLGEVAHRNILSTRYFGWANQRHFIISDWLEGVDLWTVFQWVRQKRRKIPLGVMASIAEQVIRALDYMHHIGEGVVHGHLSPSNIFLDWDGRVRVLDFGLTGVIEETQKFQFPSYLRWIAPEKVRQEPSDRRIDFFNLGLILFEGFLGKHPFIQRGEEELWDLQTLYQRAYEARIERWPSHIRIPEDLTQVLKALLDPNPLRRGQWLSQWIQPFEEILKPGGGTDRRTTLPLWLRTLVQDEEIEIPSLPGDAQNMAIQDASSLESSVLESIGDWVLHIQDHETVTHHSIPRPKQEIPGLEEAVTRIYEAFEDQYGPKGIWILGGTGVGKTYLLRQILNLWADWTTGRHIAHLTPVTPSRPFSVLGLWLESAIKLLAVHDRQEALRKVETFGEDLELNAEEKFHLRILCGLENIGETLAAKLFSVALKLIKKMIDRSPKPLILGVDNAQFIDRWSARYLHALIQEVPRGKVFFFLLADDLSFPYYFPQGLLQSLVLYEPPPLERTRILRHLLGKHATPSRIQRLNHAPESLARLADLTTLLHAMDSRDERWDEDLELLLAKAPKERWQWVLPTLTKDEVRTLQWLAVSIEPINAYALQHLMACSRSEFYGLLKKLLQSKLVIYALPGRLSLSTWYLGMSLLQVEDPKLIRELHRYLAVEYEKKRWCDWGSPIEPWIQEQYAYAGEHDKALEHALSYGMALEKSGYSEIALIHLERAIFEFQRTGIEAPERLFPLLLAKAKQAMILGQGEKLFQTFGEMEFLLNAHRLETPIFQIQFWLLEARWKIFCNQFEDAQKLIQKSLRQLGPLAAKYRNLFGELLEIKARFAYHTGMIHLCFKEIQGALQIQSKPESLLLKARALIRCQKYDEAQKLLDGLTVQRNRLVQLEFEIVQHLLHSHKMESSHWLEESERLREEAYQNHWAMLMIDILRIRLDGMIKFRRWRSAKGILEKLQEWKSHLGDFCESMVLSIDQKFIEALEKQNLALFEPMVKLSESKGWPRDQWYALNRYIVLLQRLGYDSSSVERQRDLLQEKWCHLKKVMPPLPPIPDRF